MEESEDEFERFLYNIYITIATKDPYKEYCRIPKENKQKIKDYLKLYKIDRISGNTVKLKYTNPSNGYLLDDKASNDDASKESPARLKQLEKLLSKQEFPQSLMAFMKGGNIKFTIIVAEIFFLIATQRLKEGTVKNANSFGKPLIVCPTNQESNQFLFAESLKNFDKQQALLQTYLDHKKTLKICVGNSLNDDEFIQTIHHRKSDTITSNPNTRNRRPSDGKGSHELRINRVGQRRGNLFQNYRFLFSNPVSLNEFGAVIPRNARVLIIETDETNEDNYLKLVNFIQIMNNSGIRDRLQIDQCFLQNPMKESAAYLSYANSRKLSIRLNEVSSSAFEEALNGASANTSELEYIPIHLEDCRMFILFPVYKSGALRHNKKKS